MRGYRPGGAHNISTQDLVFYKQKQKKPEIYDNLDKPLLIWMF